MENETLRSPPTNRVLLVYGSGVTQNNELIDDVLCIKTNIVEIQLILTGLNVKILLFSPSLLMYIKQTN